MAADGASYRFGAFILNNQRGCLQSAGLDLDLRPKAFEILRYLVANTGRLASKDELVQVAWPNVIVNDDSLAQCIRDIRKVLGDDGESFIRTVPRRGYMFVAEVESINTPAASATGGVVGRRRSWIAPGAVQDGRLAIAVLPFAILGASNEEWLGDGIAEDIMTAVSRFRDITVIARNSSFRFRGEALDAREVGRDLGAEFLLQGTVRRSDDRLRITAQLVDAATGTIRWSERYDRPLADLFAIQDDVAESVAAQLVAHAKQTASTRLQARPPESLEVYELVLRGRKTFRSFTRDSATEALALADQAIAIEPDHAPAWELRAAALMQFYIQPYGEQMSAEVLQKARTAAETAVALDGNFATGQAMLAFTLQWVREHDASLAAINRAIQLNPNDAAVHSIHANILTFAGRNREAIDAWNESMRVDPFYPALNLALKAMTHVMLGEFETALALTRSCSQRARLFAGSLYRAIAAHELGLKDEADEAIAMLLEINPQFGIARHMRMAPFSDLESADRLAAYMRRAGMPE
jgi:TolB-like protein/DNA-binding winged helix-turn-helix (wHTH) protein/Tfp pilus assembly protein PilF